MKMFTHVCICMCTSETLLLLWCVYLACTLLELFKGSFFQVQLQTGVKLEGWDFLADLEDFIEAFTVFTSRMTFQDMSNLNGQTGKMCHARYLPVLLQKALDGREASVQQ